MFSLLAVLLTIALWAKRTGSNQLRAIAKVNAFFVWKAMSVGMRPFARRSAKAARLIEVSEALVSTCRKGYIVDGVASFLLDSQGGTSCLSADERTEVLIWITAQTHPMVRWLRVHRQTTFGIMLRVAPAFVHLAQSNRTEASTDPSAQSKKRCGGRGETR